LVSASADEVATPSGCSFHWSSDGLSCSGRGFLPSPCHKSQNIVKQYPDFINKKVQKVYCVQNLHLSEMRIKRKNKEHGIDKLYPDCHKHGGYKGIKEKNVNTLAFDYKGISRKEREYISMGLQGNIKKRK